MHVVGKALVIEGGDRLLVDEHVLAARLVLELGDVAHERAVVREERRIDPQVAGDERFANEDLAGLPRRERTIGDRAPRYQRQSVELHALARDHFAALQVPVRVEVLAVDARAGNRLDPFRLDAAGASGKQP